MKIPKTIGACADLLYQTRQKRLELQKMVDAVAADEARLKDHIISILPKSEASGVAGRVARVAVVKKEVPKVEDWDKVYAHVAETGSWELLHRRVSEAAVRERWEEGEEVPGVSKFPVVTVSLNKL